MKTFQVRVTCKGHKTNFKVNAEFGINELTKLFKAMIKSNYHVNVRALDRFHPYARPLLDMLNMSKDIRFYETVSVPHQIDTTAKVCSFMMPYGTSFTVAHSAGNTFFNLSALYPIELELEDFNYTTGLDVRRCQATAPHKYYMRGEYFFEAEDNDVKRFTVITVKKTASHIEYVKERVVL